MEVIRCLRKHSILGKCGYGNSQLDNLLGNLFSSSRGWLDNFLLFAMPVYNTEIWVESWWSRYGIPGSRNEQLVLAINPKLVLKKPRGDSWTRQIDWPHDYTVMANLLAEQHQLEMVRVWPWDQTHLKQLGCCLKEKALSFGSNLGHFSWWSRYGIPGSRNEQLVLAINPELVLK